MKQVRPGQQSASVKQGDKDSHRHEDNAVSVSMLGNVVRGKNGDALGIWVDLAG